MFVSRRDTNMAPPYTKYFFEYLTYEKLHGLKFNENVRKFIFLHLLHFLFYLRDVFNIYFWLRDSEHKVKTAYK